MPGWTRWPLIFLNAALVNHLLTLHELQLQRNNFTGWLMLVLFWLTPASVTSTAVLLAIPFFTLCLTILLSIYRQNDAGSAYFNAAFLAAIGALFLTSGGILLFVLLLSLLYTRTPNWREITLLILGASFPSLIFVAVSYLIDKPIKLESDYSSTDQLPVLTLLFVVVVGGLAIVGLMKLLATFAFSSNKSKNSKAILMINSIGLIGCSIMLYPSSSLSAVYLSLLPFVLLIQSIFTMQKKQLWHELLFASFLVFAIWYWFQVIHAPIIRMQ